MRTNCAALPPVIILGGDPNALSVARNLGRRGICVFAVNDPAVAVRFSRYCHWLPVPWLGSNVASWTSYLLSSQADPLRGAVLLAASDEALEVIFNNRSQLAERYLLDDSNPDAQRSMLDKLGTYKAAQAAGVPLPRFWVTNLAPGDSSGANCAGGKLQELAAELVYPLLVKPLSSHRFGSKFGGQKFFVAHSFEDLCQGVERATAAGVEVMLVEQIPGLDDCSCSYYTYLDADQKPLFDYTKRVIRRYPVGMGQACYHITDRVAEVRELALRLFRQVGLRGLAHVEFKWDERDGLLKLIECNARFTAADCLLTRSGFDLASFVYNRLVGLPQAPLEKYKMGLRLWSPVEDFWAFLELRRRGQLTLWSWLRSIAHRQTFPYFRWSDPVPSLVRCARGLKLDVVYHSVRKLWRKMKTTCSRRLRPVENRRQLEAPAKDSGKALFGVLGSGAGREEGK